jgi:hypothetical protein
MSKVHKSLIRQYATLAAESIATQVIEGLKSYTATLSGDHSGLETVWEEICVQVQVEESFYWEAYQETIYASVIGLVEALDYHDLASLWLQTNNGWNWHWNVENGETDTPCVPYDLDDITKYVVSKYVLSFAESYSNKNIKAYLNGESSEGEEEAEDELREQLRALMPRDSMVLDLWDWDIYFEDESFDDLSKVAFSDNEELAEYANTLAQDFLRWIDEYGMDYNQQSGQSPDEFSAWIEQQSLDFLTKWRANVKEALINSSETGSGRRQELRQ